MQNGFMEFLSTLKDRLSGWVAHKVKSGSRPYLSAEKKFEVACHPFQASDMEF